VVLLSLYSGCASAADRLAAYPVDPSQISVAGISSGAFMANQLHVAHSADVMGAALIAGGLYGCAVQDVTSGGVIALASQAVSACMEQPFLLNDVNAYKARIGEFAARHWIDPPSNLAHSRVYLFAGGADTVVNPKVVIEAAALYSDLGLPKANIDFVDRSGPAAHAGHSWVTVKWGGACDVNALPYIDHCDYDQAGEELKAIYGEGLTAPAPALAGRIIAFDQREFAPKGVAKGNGLSDTGYVYVPKTCEAGAGSACRLQVVFHGCQQSAETLGDVFYTHIGVNEWADTNRIVVLYPQTHAVEPEELPPELALWGELYANPNGCWNWWGYADDRQFLTKKGVQIGAIWAMVERIEGK
jgi:predicted esterase